ncbi:hypothetical protein B0H63DRAFT_449829 [Podospora didyma]|uniref:Rhodopsin domain-containing protein n=1 Tax=Podospora didyma TaxID=330526 RepID=A0AAE0NQI5_9PEZI|nr:hypothetical protein B0H63DRAFT_449829 [Podospora didyma]
MLAAIWTLVALATLFLALRIYCKIWRLRKLWWDDWVLFISWVCLIVDAAMSQRVVDLGFGKYPCDIDPANFRLIALEGQNIGATFGMLAVVWSKTSFAITLLRLTEGRIKTFVWCVIILMNLVMILEALIVWVQCTPISKTWIKETPGYCWDSHKINIYGAFAGCLSGVCDILLALLPWHLIWNLQMQKKEKIGVGIAMSMGVFAGATAFVKSQKIFTVGAENFSYDGCQLLLWAVAEIGTTIMAACIPILRVFVKEVRERTTTRSHTKSPFTRKLNALESGGSDDSTMSSKSRRPNTISMAPYPKQGFQSPLESPLGADDSSEKHILPIVHEEPQTPERRAPERSTSTTRNYSRIVRTQEFAVRFDDRGNNSGDAHEMTHAPRHGRQNQI